MAIRREYRIKKKITHINLEQSTPLQKCWQRIYKKNAGNI